MGGGSRGGEDSFSSWRELEFGVLKVLASHSDKAAAVCVWENLPG